MSEIIQEMKKHRRSRPKVLETTFDLRLSWVDSRFLDTVAFYERRDTSEILRYLVTQMRKEYRRDKHFRDWIQRHKEDLKREGIPFVEDF